MINRPNCSSHNSPLIGFNQTPHVQGRCKYSVILIMATKTTRYVHRWSLLQSYIINMHVNATYSVGLCNHLR